MRTINKVLIGVIATAGIGSALIGSGAGATFTDAIHSNQSITAGTLNATVSGDGTVTGNGKTITLRGIGPTGSTFTSPKQKFTVTNNGDITANAISLAADLSTSGGTAGQALAKELYVTVTVAGTQVYDGPLAELAATAQQIAGTLKPAGSRDVTVVYYAGSGSAPSLENDVQGGSVRTSLTVNLIG